MDGGDIDVKLHAADGNRIAEVDAFLAALQVQQPAAAWTKVYIQAAGHDVWRFRDESGTCRWTIDASFSAPRDKAFVECAAPVNDAVLKLRRCVRTLVRTHHHLSLLRGVHLQALLTAFEREHGASSETAVHLARFFMHLSTLPTCIDPDNKTVKVPVVPRALQRQESAIQHRFQSACHQIAACAIGHVFVSRFGASVEVPTTTDILKNSLVPAVYHVHDRFRVSSQQVNEMLQRQKQSSPEAAVLKDASFGTHEIGVDAPVDVRMMPAADIDPSCFLPVGDAATFFSALRSCKGRLPVLLSTTTGTVLSVHPFRNGKETALQERPAAPGEAATIDVLVEVVVNKASDVAPAWLALMQFLGLRPDCRSSQSDHPTVMRACAPDLGVTMMRDDGPLHDWAATMSSWVALTRPPATEDTVDVEALPPAPAVECAGNASPVRPATTPVVERTLAACAHPIQASLPALKERRSHCVSGDGQQRNKNRNGCDEDDDNDGEVMHDDDETATFLAQLSCLSETVPNHTMISESLAATVQRAERLSTEADAAKSTIPKSKDLRNKKDTKNALKLLHALLEMQVAAAAAWSALVEEAPAAAATSAVDVTPQTRARVAAALKKAKGAVLETQERIQVLTDRCTA